MLRKLLASFAALALLLPGPAMGWGAFGHRTTAKIALANIAPQTRREIERLLRSEKMLGTPDCSLKTLEDASVWPDCVRRDRLRWGYTAAWHYRTAPICEAYNARANCSGGSCVTGQIERNAALLADRTLPDHVRLEALAFLTHFVGDVHMPLHSGDKQDRGGNDREAAYGIVPGMNLHWIWDGALAERAITTDYRVLVRRYSAAERTELAGGDAAEWGRESWQMAREVVYASAYDRDPCTGEELPERTVLSQQDIVDSIPPARLRVAQAGLRLARLLDEALAR